MKTNNLLTLLLYALLIGLVLVGGYKACQMRNDKAELAKQTEALKQWDDMRHTNPDSNATGSSFAGGDTTLSSHTTASKDGIEDEPSASSNNAPKTTAAPAPAPQTSSTATTAPKPEPKTETPAAAPKTLVPKSPSKGSTAPKSVKGLGSGRYSVRVGSFGDVDRARNQLEKVIKLGFVNAEINKINNGKLSTVVVFRSNDKAAATKIMDQLEAKGVDALVHDSQKK